MAIGVIFESDGLTQAQYDQARREVAPDNIPPPGMLYHAAGPSEHGWRVIEVWESQEVAQRFFEEKVNPALERFGVSGKDTFFEVHNIMQPAFYRGETLRPDVVVTETGQFINDDEASS